MRVMVTVLFVVLEAGGSGGATIYERFAQTRQATTAGGGKPHEKIPVQSVS
jgi:hypothetical protein